MAHDARPPRRAVADAGELRGLALEELLDSEISAASPRRLAISASGTPHFQAERHVVVHGHVRVQGVILENPCDVASFGGRSLRPGRRS